MAHPPLGRVFGDIKGLADPAWRLGAGVGLILLATALFDPRLLNDGDTYWHVAAGRWMSAHAQVPHVDPFSFTLQGAPWQAHEWLSEVLMALAFGAGGWAGVAALYGAALAAAALLLTRALGRSLSGLSFILTLVLALACVAPNLLARPHILILPIVISWTAALLRAREAGRAPPLWVAGLMLVWANLHGGFVFGFLVLGGFGLEALIDSTPERRWKTLRDWALFGALCVVAAAITPQGLEGLIFPFKLMGMTSLAGIDEWRPLDLGKPGPFEIAVGAALFVSFTRGLVVRPIRLLLLIGLIYMTLQHNRHAMIAAMVGALVMAEPLAKALGQPKPETRPAHAGAWLAFAAAALMLIAARAAQPATRADGPTTPGAALDHVPAALKAQPMFNGYGFGGYLIFRGVRPYIDGRADLYGDAFMDRYLEIMSPDPAALDQTLSERRIAWTLLPPDAPLVAVMDAKPGWRRIYADRYAIVHARAGTGAKPGMTAE